MIKMAMKKTCPLLLSPPPHFAHINSRMHMQRIAYLRNSRCGKTLRMSAAATVAAICLFIFLHPHLFFSLSLFFYFYFHGHLSLCTALAHCVCVCAYNISIF